MIEHHAIDQATGAIRQIKTVNAPKRYDSDYVEAYNKLDCARMSELRWSIIHRFCKIIGLMRVLDFGCGNGAFLLHGEHYWKPRINMVGRPLSLKGFDVVADYPIEGVEKVSDPAADEYDVVTFFDSLEHVHDVDGLLANLQTRFVVVSLPWCHARVLGAEWLRTWKHFKPDEHLWYFDVVSLCTMMSKHRFKLVHAGSEEDLIRKPVDLLPNILTAVFEKDYSVN